MINLLPFQYQKELKREENLKIILILEIIFLIFLFSLILVLILVKLYFYNQLLEFRLNGKIIEESKPQFSLEKFKQINKDISKILSFYQKEIIPSEILERVFQTIPSSIYLTNFSWQKANSQITLNGVSLNREALLQFKKNLEEKKEFKEINFPIQSWIKNENINFNIAFKLETQ